MLRSWGAAGFGVVSGEPCEGVVAVEGAAVEVGSEVVAGGPGGDVFGTRGEGVEGWGLLVAPGEEEADFAGRRGWRGAETFPPLPGGPVRPLWQGGLMSPSDASNLVPPAVTQIAADAFNDLAPVCDALDAAARLAQEQAATLIAAIDDQQVRLGTQWVERINQTLAAALPSWQNDINRAAEALAGSVAAHVQALQRIDLTFDTTGLNRVFQDLEAWQHLDTGQRAAAAQVLDDAYRHSHDLADEAPDDLVARLEDTAYTFASTQSGLLNPELQRQLFVWFFGLLTLAVLMQASFTSETADAVIEKVMALSPAAVLAMAAADKVWGKGTRHSEGDEEEEGQD